MAGAPWSSRTKRGQYIFSRPGDKSFLLFFQLCFLKFLVLVLICFFVFGTNLELFGIIAYFFQGSGKQILAMGHQKPLHLTEHPAVKPLRYRLEVGWLFSSLKK